MKTFYQFFITLMAALCLSTTAWAERVIIDTLDQQDIVVVEQHQDEATEEAIEEVFEDEPSIVVDPYYDEYGRQGARVTPRRGQPYYVDPHYDNPTPQDHEADESITDSHWRVLGW